MTASRVRSLSAENAGSGINDYLHTARPALGRKAPRDLKRCRQGQRGHAGQHWRCVVRPCGRPRVPSKFMSWCLPSSHYRLQPSTKEAVLRRYDLEISDEWVRSANQRTLRVGPTEQADFCREATQQHRYCGPRVSRCRRRRRPPACGVVTRVRPACAGPAGLSRSAACRRQLWPAPVGRSPSEIDPQRQSDRQELVSPDKAWPHPGRAFGGSLLSSSTIAPSGRPGAISESGEGVDLVDAREVEPNSKASDHAGRCVGEVRDAPSGAGHARC